jgi:hypothetical protein
VTAAQVAEQDLAAAGVEVDRRRRRRRSSAVRRVGDEPRPGSAASVGIASATLRRPRAAPVSGTIRAHRSWPQIGAGRKRWLPNA